ncbi:DUF3999 family protein [Novosphingobium sp. FSY-8]|uniref:DUF3999 family protein n=1 Tax=Novosphingobium ovatum TaxID=1908523 RepID=A0ABW9XGT7_9SPHN|nr:DUF3999 family protein [Novosphingobium ovatum]NBC37777.1 DUF3999 family protein [Novosphingobium ovatum]
MKRAAIALTLALTLALPGCGAPRAAPTGPQDFALNLPVTAPGTGVARLDLPVAALLAFRRADMGDVRVYDAQGRPLSIARMEPAAASQNAIHLPAIAINEDRAADGAAVSVQVDQAGRRLTVATQGPAAGAAATAQVLLDTRSLADRAVAVRLDADLPPSRPVTVEIASSPDLKSWTPLTDAVLLRPGAGPELLGGGRIALPDVALQGRYVRLRWQGAPPGAVQGATLITSHTPAPPRLWVTARGIPAGSAQQMAFTLPVALQPGAVRVAMTGADGVVPLRLMGRDSAEAPWTPLAVGVLRQGAKATELPLEGIAPRQLLLEADPRSAGWSRPPALALALEPVSLLVAFNGAAPYRLAVGHADAAPALFAASDLAPNPGTYPRAQVAATGAGETFVDLGGEGTSWPFAPRKLALWGALLAGTGVLGMAVVRLLRANARPVDRP